MAEHLATEPAKTGTYHFAGTPDTSWAVFACAIMAEAGLPCVIEDIPSSAYPTPARRPANSRLDCAGLARFGLTRPDWRSALTTTLAELRERP
jgi:dTDP-4-dehydrorhamnose reductase